VTSILGGIDDAERITIVAIAIKLFTEPVIDKTFIPHPSVIDADHLKSERTCIKLSDLDARRAGVPNERAVSIQQSLY